MPNIIGAPDEARVTAAQSDIQAISNALELYRLDNSIYPSTEQGLKRLLSNQPGFRARNWGPEPYLKKGSVDPWDEPYYYFSEDEVSSLVLIARKA